MKLINSNLKIINTDRITAEIEVPSYQTIEIGRKSSCYCLCVFVINEGERIRKQLAAMSSFANIVDIIIADGGSTDSSLQIDYLKENRVTTMLIKTGSGKLSAQMRIAFHHALTQGYEGIIVVDGNNKDGMHAIPNFLEQLNAGYDHVQGSRFIKGGKAVNTPKIRHLAVTYIHAPLIRMFSGYHYTDTTNGFRAYSKALLTDSRIKPLRHIFTGYELHYYLALRAAQLEFKIIEVPVSRTYPKGRVPTKISPLKGNLVVLATLLKACLGIYNTKDGKHHE